MSNASLEPDVASLLPMRRVADIVGMQIAGIAALVGVVGVVLCAWLITANDIANQTRRLEERARGNTAAWVAATINPVAAKELHDFDQKFQSLRICAINFWDRDGKKFSQELMPPPPRHSLAAYLETLFGHEFSEHKITIDVDETAAGGVAGQLVIYARFIDLLVDQLHNLAIIILVIFIAVLVVAGSAIVIVQQRLGTPLGRLAGSLSVLDPASPVHSFSNIVKGDDDTEIGVLIVRIREMLRANAVNLAGLDRELRTRRFTERRMQDFFAASSDFFMEFDRSNRLQAMGRSRQSRTVLLAFYRAYENGENGILRVVPGADPQWERLLEIARGRRAFRNFMLAIPQPGMSETLYISLSAVPIFDDFGDFCGHRAALTDVSQSVYAQQQIENERSFVRKAYDVMPAQLLVVNLGFEIIYANQRMAAQLGHNIDHLIGRNLHDILPDMPRDGVAVSDLMLADMRRAIDDNRPSFGVERQHVTKGGQIETTLHDCVPFHDNAGAPLGVLLLATPISERKGIENNLRLANAQLEQQARDLQHLAEEYARERQMAYAANRAKSDFLANMSHELRTPLNAVIGFAELIVRQPFGPILPRYKEYADDIVFSARHLLSIITDILDMSKLEAGRYVINAEVSEAGNLVDGAVRMLQVRASNAGIALTTSYSADLPQLLVDVRAVRQIMVNLLGNAIKFTRAGGSVAVRASPAINGGVDIVVSDTGIGIRSEDQQRLFEPFWQAEGAHVKTFEGTGLGLSICRRLIDLHGGTIEIESIFGEGTKVVVHFPPSCVVGRAEGSAQVAI